MLSCQIFSRTLTRKITRSSMSSSCSSSYSSSVQSVTDIYSHVKCVYSAAIAAVSPVKLVSNALSFDRATNTLTAGNSTYKLNRNVKVVAFGKAVLGMVAAVESIIGEHITGGVASIPVGSMQTARTHFPQYLPMKHSKVRIYEGAFNNLPDKAAESAALEILKLVQDAGEDELILTLISGGGSSLLPCPVNGVSLEEKKQVLSCLAKRGADISELNMFRKAVSQTKGGKLAKAAYPSKVLALILSDVIGDPLGTIASGPTVPNCTSTHDVVSLLDKYLSKEELPSSIVTHLSKLEDVQSVSLPINSDGQYTHTENMLIGTNQVATEAAAVAAKKLGYSCHVWYHSLHGEARELGMLFATLAHNIVLAMEGKPQEPFLDQMIRNFSQELKESIMSLQSSVHDIIQTNKQLCLISGGEPTVTVMGNGKGGRNQEMALAFALKLHELRGRAVASHCVFASVGTDGQDGPCDAAGAVVDTNIIYDSSLQALDPVAFLVSNDSYTYFSRLNAGRNMIKTGLTGTNVMDIQLLLINNLNCDH